MITENTKLELIAHLNKTPKGKRTWKEIGNLFGLSKRQARHIWEYYNEIPTIDTYEDKVIELIPENNIPEGWEAVPSGQVFKDGTIGYKLRKIEEAVDEKSFKEIVKEALEDFEPFEVEGVKLRSSTTYFHITDVHIGMDTVGTIFKQEWNQKRVLGRIDTMLSYVEPNKNVCIINTSDTIDSELKFTSSRTHQIPGQPGGDAVYFKDAVLAHRRLIDGCLSISKGKVTLRTVTNCNHNTHSDLKVAFALEMIYEDNPMVEIEIYNDFLGHVETEDAWFILTHGKDNHIRKRGLSLPLKPAEVDMINKYIKDHNIGTEGKQILLVRGDLHRSEYKVYDQFTSIMTNAFSPASAYIANNYGSNDPGGFAVIDFILNNPRISYITFND